MTLAVEVALNPNTTTLYHTILTFNNPFENIVGKVENAGNQL